MTDTMKKIIDYFTDNQEVFNYAISELDSYNGYLNNDRYYYMEDINDHFIDSTPDEIIARVYYGYDQDTYIYDSIGNKHHQEFNPNREYFKYNGYGNLVSTDYIDYSDYIDEYAIKAMLDHRLYIYTIDDDATLSGLFDELETEG